MQPCGIMFHHFHGSGHSPGQGSIDAAQLADLVDFVGMERILPAREWFDRAVNGKLQAADICLTFDDSLRCQFDVAKPVLDDLRLTGFWFVSSQVVNGSPLRIEIYRKFRDTCFASIEHFYSEFFTYVQETPHAQVVSTGLDRLVPDTYLSEFPFYSALDRQFRYVRDMLLGPEAYQQVMDNFVRRCGAEIDELSQNLWITNDDLLLLAREGHVVGLHSDSHPTRMANLSREEQLREYTINHAHLSNLLGQPPQCMSHPCNSYNGDTLDILQGLGIKLGFRSDMTEYIKSELEYPREDHALVVKRMRL